MEVLATFGTLLVAVFHRVHLQFSAAWHPQPAVVIWLAFLENWMRPRRRSSNGRKPGSRSNKSVLPTISPCDTCCGDESGVPLRRSGFTHPQLCSRLVKLARKTLMKQRNKQKRLRQSGSWRSRNGRKRSASWKSSKGTLTRFVAPQEHLFYVATES